MGLFLCTIMAVLSLGGGFLLFSGIGYLHTDKMCIRDRVWTASGCTTGNNVVLIPSPPHTAPAVRGPHLPLTCSGGVDPPCAKILP